MSAPETAADGPICKHCGSPWFEPQYGALFCCDCGKQHGTTGGVA